MQRGVRMVFVIDGLRVQPVYQRDINKDGKIDDIETVTPYSEGTQPILEGSELGEVFKSMDTDAVEADTRLSTIDFNARIHHVELPYMVAFDSLIGAKIIPVHWGILTRSKMRKSVSLEGKGRQEKAQIAIGKREHDSEMQGGFMKKMGNQLFGQKEQST